MDIDGVDLVHEELEPCPEQMYQSSFEASELANLYEPYSDWEKVRYIDDTKGDGTDVSVDLSSGGLHWHMVWPFMHI